MIQTQMGHNCVKRCMTRSIEVLTWKDVRHDVMKVKPELAYIIDQLSPPDQCRLYKTRYSFGDKILNQGLLQLPNKNGDKLINASDDTISKHYQNDLFYNYQAKPVTLVLENSIELYLRLPERIVPYSFIKPGNFFGLWRVFDPKLSACPVTSCWEMTAGARSLFMVPKISEDVKYNKLKRMFNLASKKPQTPLEHWEIFRIVGNANHTTPPWQTTVLYFSKHWFEHLHDPAWQYFHNFLLRSAWSSNAFWRDQSTWNMLFNHIQTNHHLKVTPYNAGLAKSVLMAAVGAVPAFKPASDNTAGPISLLQEVISDIYGLKNYAPTIMQPELFSMFNKNDTAYLSLLIPTAMELPPRTNPHANIIKELVALQSLLSIYLKNIAEKKSYIESSLLDEVPELVDINYFHNQAVGYPNIFASETIPRSDQQFINNNYAELPVATDAPFFRACVQLKAKAK